jgi:NAD(P)-dependent dehydrogenase (short-subunit alcohol dehydrogenase family)
MSPHTISDSLKGQRVVLLGGSSGFGLATAQAAAAEGAQVVIVSSRQTSIDQALAQLPAGSEGHVADLTQEMQTKAFFEKSGSFDHLVYTAGESLLFGPLKDLTIADAKKFFDLRYFGMVAAVKYGTPHIKPGGSILLTGGTYGQRPKAGASIGASVLTAVEGFMRAMAVELAPIRVNMVIGGVVKSPLWSNLTETDREGLYDHVAKTMLLKRVGDLEDIARAYLYLMCQTWSTGQAVVVDGGDLLS